MTSSQEKAQCTHSGQTYQVASSRLQVHFLPETKQGEREGWDGRHIPNRLICHSH
jgi:hypothetical protein